MNILIFTYGFLGDVKPFTALGKGIKQKGHHTTVCTAFRFKTFIPSNGFEYGYMSDAFLKILNTPEGRGIIENAANISPC